MKKSLLFLPLTTLIMPFVLSSCSNNENVVVFALSTPFNEGDPNEFVKIINKKTNEKIDKINSANSNNNKQIQNIKIKAKIHDGNLVKKQSLQNGSANFAFLNTKTVIDDDFYKKENIFPTIQTLTSPFNFDTDMSKKYVNGTENDPLRKIAKKMQEVSFDVKPFSEWKDEDFQWEKYRYQSFYDLKNLTNKYRGMILFTGNDEQIKLATKYWDEKDWNNFRNLGIITGEATSVGLYQLQEKILKKHFDKKDNTFTTLVEDKNKNPSKYIVDPFGTEKLGTDSNFVISFAEEGSFAWTNSIKSPNSFRPSKGSKIKIFSSTNPAFYDIGVFSNINKIYVDLMTESIAETFKEGLNSYGNGLGYNGYKTIINFENEIKNEYDELNQL